MTNFYCQNLEICSDLKLKFYKVTQIIKLSLKKKNYRNDFTASIVWDLELARGLFLLFETLKLQFEAWSKILLKKLYVFSSK